MTITIEVWKPIPGYETRYEVSNLGRVRSLGARYFHAGNNTFVTKRPRILKQSHVAGAYPVVNLSDDGEQTTYRVHVLVLSAFRGPRPEGHETRHLDGNRVNARLSNLKWGTHAENEADKVKHGRAGRAKPSRGEDHYNAKLTWEKVKAIRQAHANGASIKGLAKAHGVRRNTMRSVIRNQTWKEAA